MTLGLYAFDLDCGRQGSLHALHVLEDTEYSKILAFGEEVYLGECLGKHSEVITVIDEDDLTLVSDRERDVAVFEDLFPDGFGHTFVLERVRDAMREAEDNEADGHTEGEDEEE